MGDALSLTAVGSGDGVDVVLVLFPQAQSIVQPSAAIIKIFVFLIFVFFIMAITINSFQTKLHAYSHSIVVFLIFSRYVHKKFKNIFRKSGTNF